MSTYDSITMYQVKFVVHPKDPNMHIHLNHLYGEMIPNPEILFTDPNHRDTIVTNDELLERLRQSIVQDLIVPYATETIDASVIERIIEQAPIFVMQGNLSRRLTRESLIQALEHAKKETRS